MLEKMTTYEPQQVLADIPPGLTVADVMLRIPKVHPPSATVADMHALFADDHVHAALVVDGERLVAVIERADLVGAQFVDQTAAGLGCLADRTVSPSAGLPQAYRQLRDGGRRRLAVVDSRGRLVGLLCLKQRGIGFCSDADVASRARERGEPSVSLPTGQA
jgi:CBS domain-containing protein